MATSSINGLGSRPAFLFPGQGSQTVGMGKDLYESSPAARKLFDQVDQALGEPLTKYMFEGPEEELNRTWNCQPAIMAMSLACLAAAGEANKETVSSPYLMAGHSLGEYTALVVSGVMDLSHAVNLVRERGRLMEEACEEHPGSMAAILGLDQAVVEEVCRQAGVQVANINSPGQIVISGDREKLDEAVKLAKEQGARKVIRLPVSGAFHSYLMGPALGGMLKALDDVEFNHPSIPVIGNCTAKPLNANRDVKEELAEQLCGCVQWQECISYMLKEGVTSFIEFGPGKVLSGLVKQITKEAPVLTVNDLASAQGLSNGLSGN
ncbi:MAG: ACP S-malonyltransferase [Chloroflexi bacterium]|nr:ACP S-malonyltransferase [Chloroflexota bacterium]